MKSAAFTFHIVQIKLLSLKNSITKSVKFTFHIVQIKPREVRDGKIRVAAFTFHIVQIKQHSGNNDKNLFRNIYIPHSSDKTRPSFDS